MPVKVIIRERVRLERERESLYRARGFLRRNQTNTPPKGGERKWNNKDKGYNGPPSRPELARIIMMSITTEQPFPDCQIFFMFL